MSGKIKNEHGTIAIDENVLATIAGLAATECYGIVGMAKRGTTEGLFELLRKENLTKGVKIYTKDDTITVDLYIIVQFGTKISVVAENIIEKVKYNIEKFTGMNVEKVNINVQGVRVQK